MRVLVYIMVALAGLIILPWDVAVKPGPMLRNATHTDADQPQRTSAYTRDVVYFPSQGVKCQAWLYMPKQFEGAKPPIVIAAHGLGAQKDFGLSAYGERFAEAGLASLIFDYRTFGGSDGQPRHWASPRRHLQDWRAAVEYVQTQLGDKVQANRVMLWGTSFAGGHVLAIAAELGSNITAVVAQVPFLDGKASFTRSIKEKGILRVARAVIAGIHDKARSFFTYPAAYYPLTGRPGSFCFMGLSEDDEATYYSKHPPQKQGGWQNLARCSLALEVSSYRPVTLLHKIKAPVLFIAADQDKLCPAAEIEKAAAKTPNAKFVSINCSHFDIYSGQPLQYLMDEMVAFYQEAAVLVSASNTAADAADQVTAAAGDVAAAAAAPAAASIAAGATGSDEL